MRGVTYQGYICPSCDFDVKISGNHSSLVYRHFLNLIKLHQKEAHQPVVAADDVAPLDIEKERF